MRSRSSTPVTVRPGALFYCVYSSIQEVAAVLGNEEFEIQYYQSNLGQESSAMGSFIRSTSILHSVRISTITRGIRAGKNTHCSSMGSFDMEAFATWDEMHARR